MESDVEVSKLLQVLLQSLPLSIDRKSDISTSLQTFHVKLQYVDGLKEPDTLVNYHIQALLFDQKYGTFVGSSWKGKPVPNEFSQVHFNQNVYFYTTIPAQDLGLVIELVGPSQVPNQDRSYGWMLLNLLNTTGEETEEEEKPLYYKVPLVHGSPISLIPSEDIRKKAKKKKKEKSDNILKKTGMEISLSQVPFPGLLQISHLFPENVLIDASYQIPGLSSRAVDASHSLRPSLQKCVTFLLERPCVRLHLPREQAEKGVLDAFQLHRRLAAAESGAKEAPPLMPPERGSVMQRRMQVGVHNGYCFVQDPDIYHLHVEPCSTPTPSKAMRRASSMGSLSVSREECLVVRSDIKLFEIPDDPNVFIVFLLEYVISLPDAKEDSRPLPSSLNKKQTATVAIGWGACPLGGLRGNPSQCIRLTCDPSACPHRTLLLATGQQLDISFSAFSLLKQNKLSSVSYPSDDHASDMTSPGQSRDTSHFRPFSSSTPKHKSVADIPMTVYQSEAEHSKRLPTKTESRKNEYNLALQEVTLVSSSLPVVPPLLHSFSGVSSESFPKLYWEQLQPVLDHSGQPATLIDSSAPYRIDMGLELHCPPMKNEYRFNFLALSGLNELVETPSEVFFTFQFYRFMPLKSESLSLTQLSETEDDSFSKSSLVYAFHRPEDRTKRPGFQVSYNIDPTELSKGEYKSFLQYLMKQTLFVDLWNGQSLLYFGTVALPLKYLCRQGKEATVSNLELDVVSCEYPDESLTQHGNIPAKSSPLGKLHLQASSVRHPLSAKALEMMEEENETSNSIIVQSKADEHSTGKSPTVSVARRIAETNRELSRLLSDRCAVNSNMTPEPQVTEERRRKLARMEALREMEKNGENAPTEEKGLQFFFMEREKDLVSIHSYIEKNKSEIIRSFLHRSVTTEKRIFPSCGQKAFFEFVLENPFPVAKRIEMAWECTELRLVVDQKEWQVLRTMNGVSKKVDLLPIEVSSQDVPRFLLLQARERVHVPFTYECMQAQSGTMDLFKAVSGHHFSTDVLSSLPTLDSLDTCIKVRFLTEGTLLAVLKLVVQPLPPPTTHTFKFLSMEHSMFNKSIQLNGGDSSGKGGPVSVKCYHPEVVCSVQEGLEENASVHIKAPTQSSGRSTHFHVFVYRGDLLLQTWLVSVRPLQRIDLSCVAGQLMRSSLMLRGTHATNLVRCSSSSRDLQLHPSEPFVLSPFAVQELGMNVRSLLPGTKYFQITMVNQALEQVLQSWLLVLSCQKPPVSKAFQVHLPLARETAKRITYTNPYPNNRSLVLHSSHPHLLHLREQAICVGPGESHGLGLYFAPQDYIFTATVFLYLNDASMDKNEETYCIKVVCQ